ncbi:dihydropteroate synthase [Belliella aquatica]|uniref:dihydropteroate synthase n=1 Tax=Belliella aquatica TaxID=1323734 RepID=A0ABQ1M7L4_9BACT|nr:dihydropteroate synthase [Belliella aquatica]MCH7404951.1 dihydropteroate synthase [Belliella aquatica]GGC32857.1 dihydropteroate synthase [Belliella aquatica]
MNTNSHSTSEIEDKLFPSKITLRSTGKLLLLDKPMVMGILNVTPDSFYEGSRLLSDNSKVLKLSEKMLLEGADILDIGGYSSRPGADEVSEEEELERVIPAINKIQAEFPKAIISIDTFRAKVAKEAILNGAAIVNDISAGSLDSEMISTVGKLNVPYIAMHMKGNPKVMQTLTEYDDVILEMMKYFSEKLNECKKAGIKDVIIDPGFGFAKTVEQNYWILKNLSYFKTIQAPILVGVSRKSMIYKKLETTAENALNGTTALNMVALINGANILRVHDVKEAIETVKLYKQLYS